MVPAAADSVLLPTHLEEARRGPTLLERCSGLTDADPFYSSRSGEVITLNVTFMSRKNSPAQTVPVNI